MQMHAYNDVNELYELYWLGLNLMVILSHKEDREIVLVFNNVSSLKFLC